MPADISEARGVEHTAIKGLGVYRPERVVPNSEIIGPINSSDEWIKTRSGIESRRWASRDDSVVSMSVEAGRKALVASDVAPEQVDCVIVATSTHFRLTPPASVKVATDLGMNGTAAFDLGAGCAGFGYGLAVASDMVRGGSARHVLVVGAEQLSETLDPTDRSTAFIFGDGAGAAVVGASDTAGIGPVSWGSSGEHWLAVRQDRTWLELFDDLENRRAEAVRPYLRMEGTEVFRWAATALEKACRDALDRAGVDIDDLDVLIPHQANLRISDVMARVLKLSDNVVVAKDIVETGNTSAASIPLAMEQLLRTGQAKPGDTALLLGFGAGLTYAGQVVKLPTL